MMVEILVYMSYRECFGRNYELLVLSSETRFCSVYTMMRTMKKHKNLTSDSPEYDGVVIVGGPDESCSRGRVDGQTGQMNPPILSPCKSLTRQAVRIRRNISCKATLQFRCDWPDNGCYTSLNLN